MINPASKIPLCLEEAKANRFHFIGVGGSGMAPIASTLAHMGHSVTGSDVRPLSKELKLRLIDSQQGHKPGLVQQADIVVVSSAINETNPELIWAKEKNLKLLHRSDVLNALINSAKLSIGISGTSGKSTTSGLCLSALSGFSPEPIGVVGAVSMDNMVKKLGKTLHQKPYTLVAELDESDGSFVKYSPSCLVVHNIDRDHVGAYGSEEKIEDAFFAAAKNLPTKASLVLNWDHPKCRNLFRRIESARSDINLLSYGRSMGSEVRLLSRAIDGLKQKITVQWRYETVEVNVPGLGEFLASNTLAALAAATSLGQPLSRAVKGIEGFSGLSRRMELIQKMQNSVLYSDYAHNPEKLSAAISGIKEAFPKKKVCALFQPHRYSRTNELWDDFLKSFRKADELYLLPTYSAGEAVPENFSMEQFCLQIEKTSGCKTSFITNEEFCSLSWLNACAVESAYIALGAGDIHSMLCTNLKN